MQPVEIENIEELRHQAGIFDVELESDIRALAIGDFVKVTLLTGTRPFGAETVLVQITDIRRYAFLGELAQRPTSFGLSKLSAGSALAFTAAHIHSIPKRQPADED